MNRSFSCRFSTKHTQQDAHKKHIGNTMDKKTGKDKKKFSSFHALTVGHHNERFWYYLVHTKYKLSYRHPSLSWYQLAISKRINQMCPHLHARSHDPWSQQDSNRLIRHLVTVFSHLFKRRSASSVSFPDDLHDRSTVLCCESSSSSSSSSSFGICLHPDCNTIGCGDIFFEPQQYSGHLYQHYKSTKHSVVLKISNLSFLEIWCYACNRPLGYWGSGEKNSLPASEEYMIQKWMQYLTRSLDVLYVQTTSSGSLPDLTASMRSPVSPLSTKTMILAQHQLRRQWESRLLLSKLQSPCFLLDSHWFFAWVHYLSTPSAHPPSFSAQHHFFLHPYHVKTNNNGEENCYHSRSHHLSTDVSQMRNRVPFTTINPNLKLNVHFVVVSCQLYCYIQRIYGIEGPTIHIDQLQHKDEYKELLQQIKYFIDTNNGMTNT
ncbi:hypothetical protein BCR42DRAFT_465673 [Absidia repens]|uniref:UBP-type domain-containing protein n=1 Tax=Absidia repens TaxID=90262 RepID=A0A1X2IH94_9FUNG|nr:hypothetical protein BCR42DRAFT_465673 [Absidia repens]